MYVNNEHEHRLAVPVKNILEDQLLLDKLIGRSNNCVYSGIYKRSVDDNVSCAIKRLQLKNFDEMKEIVNEVTALAKVNDHPNIVTVYGTCTLTGISAFYLVMELMDCSLHDALHESSDTPIGDRLVLHWTIELARGLKFIHDHKMVHRDIKPANILLRNDRQTLKIADFGMARHADLTLTVTNAPGTTPYTAPEVFIDCRAHHTSRDVYSFGIVLWEMASRQKPYDGLEHAHIMFNVCGEKRLRPAETQQNVPASLWMLIRRAWHQDAEDRPTIDELLHDLTTPGPLIEMGTLSDLAKQANDRRDYNSAIKHMKALIAMRGKLSIDEIQLLKRVYYVETESGSSDDKRRTYCRDLLQLIETIDISRIRSPQWIKTYCAMYGDCYFNMNNTLDDVEKRQLWPTIAIKFRQLIALIDVTWPISNHPDRVWLIYYFATICRAYWSVVDADSIDLLIRLKTIAGQCGRGGGASGVALSETEFFTASYWLLLIDQMLAEIADEKATADAILGCHNLEAGNS